MTLDNTWKIVGAKASNPPPATFSARWTGSAGKTIPAYGHFLITGTSYVAPPASDDALSTGITDAASLRLVHGAATVDEVCYAFDATTQMYLSAASYACPGTPASNAPHNDSAGAASDVDQSIERKPGDPGNNCTDTNDSAADFKAQAPATPDDSASAPTP